MKNTILLHGRSGCGKTTCTDYFKKIMKKNGYADDRLEFKEFSASGEPSISFLSPLGMQDFINVLTGYAHETEVGLIREKP